MNSRPLFAVLVLLFLILSLLSILSFTTLDKMKWLDNGMDMLVGIVLIHLGSVLFITNRRTKNKNILYSALGILLMAFQKVLEIFLQEWQVSIGYQYPPGLLGLNLGIIGWGIADLLFAVGIFMIYLGMRDVIR